MNTLRSPVRFSERGRADTKVSWFVTIVLIGIVALLAWKFIPPYVHYRQFSHKVQTHLNWDRFHKKVPPRPDEVHEIIMQEAASYKIPLDAKKLKVWRDGEQKLLYAEIDYTEVINLPLLGEKRWRFHERIIEEKMR